MANKESYDNQPQITKRKNQLSFAFQLCALLHQLVINQMKFNIVWSNNGTCISNPDPIRLYVENGSLVLPLLYTKCEE